MFWDIMGGSTIFVREIRVGRHRQALQALQQSRQIFDVAPLGLCSRNML